MTGVEPSSLANTKLWINLALIFPFLMALLAGWAAFQISGLSSSLASRGVITTATITNKRILGGHGSATAGRIPSAVDFNVYYAFETPDGKVQSISDVLRLPNYERYKIGQKVKVRYLPEDPTFNEIIAGRQKSANAWAAAGMALFFALIGIVAVYLVKIRPASAFKAESSQGLEQKDRQR